MWLRIEDIWLPGPGRRQLSLLKCQNGSSENIKVP